jgi:hypothetical protein
VVLVIHFLFIQVYSNSKTEENLSRYLAYILFSYRLNISKDNRVNVLLKPVIPAVVFLCSFTSRCKSKGKFHPRKSHEGPEGE